MPCQPRSKGGLVDRVITANEVMFCFESQYGSDIVDTEMPWAALAAASANLLPLMPT